MRRILASIAAAGILVVGAIALTGVTASGVSAQETDEATTEAPRAHLTKALGELVADGVITQDQADAVSEKLHESFDGVRPFRRGFDRGFGVGSGVGTLGDLLGVTTDELIEQLQDGASIAEVAEANDVDPQTVIDALVAEATERVEAAVESGRIDQATADERIAQLEERITAMVNGELERPFFDGRRGARFGADTATDEEAAFGA